MTFMVQFSVYFCHLFLISSAFVMSLTFLLRNHVHPCMKCSLDISTFLEEVSSLSHFIVFLYFFALIPEEGFLISPCYLWNSAFKWVYPSFSLCFLFPLFSQLFVRPPYPAILVFCISFSWGWSWSLSPVKCQEPHSIVIRHAIYQI